MRKTNILIVDDHPIFADGLAFLLRTHEQYQVAGIARNGDEALTFLKIKPVHLVLMDIRMPVMDGIEATRQIRHLYPDLKVIALTADDSGGESVNKILAAGACNCLNKGTSLSELTSVISQSLGLNQAHKINPPKSSPKSTFWHKLTEREQQVVEFMAGGCTTIQIAELLYISPLTVKTHRARIMRKLNIRNEADLVRLLAYQKNKPT